MDANSSDSCQCDAITYSVDSRTRQFATQPDDPMELLQAAQAYREGT